MTAVWGSVATSLTVTGAGADVQAVERALDPVRAAAEERPGMSVRYGPGEWTLTVDALFSADPDEQIAALAALVEPRIDRIGDLARSGCLVRIDVSGTVGTRERLVFSARSAERLAALGLPLSFTTLMKDGIPSEDPLAWLAPPRSS
ncbi:DUF4279 domain-containing protein [Streptomyces cinereoruber]|uniref:DUF4279 domain-containing protein n=1 Tax=Streptomyces cinereoruber TaxID=67260 RepID=UPI003BF4E84A